MLGRSSVNADAVIARSDPPVFVGLTRVAAPGMRATGSLELRSMTFANSIPMAVEVAADCGSSLARLSARKQEIRRRADATAYERAKWRRRAAFFHGEDLQFLRFLIPEGARVLELGCSTGELLAALRPSWGVGVDLSSVAVAQARQNFPDLSFHVGDVEEIGREAWRGRAWVS